MLKEALAFIAQLATNGIKPDVTSFYGRQHQAGPHKYEPIEQPRAAPLLVHTLEAVNLYLKDNKDALAKSMVMVHVVDHRTVNVVGPLRDDRTRECFLSAKPINDDEVGAFLNKMHNKSSFVLGVQKYFIDTPARVELLALVGNLTAEKAKTLVDDGVTQEVAVKSTGVRVGNATVKHPLLQPRRSFPEITLDTVQYVIRMDGGGEGQFPSVGLFEADGGAWRVDAIGKIAEKLIENAEEPRAWGILS